MREPSSDLRREPRSHPRSHPTSDTRSDPTSDTRSDPTSDPFASARPLALLLAAAAVPSCHSQGSAFSRFRRSVQVPAPGQACVILDATTFAHAAPFLKDLRLYDGSPGAHEIPFVLTLSEAQEGESEPAHILNLGVEAHAISFDLAMPNRPYTEVVLDLAGQNFLATANVTGISAPGSREGTRLGSFNLFDLSAQHLSRSTSLHLQESSFPFLHITLTASPAGDAAFTPTPAMVRGATIPPSREAQTLFTVATETSTFEQRGKSTLAHLSLPARVPIEQLAFTLDPAFHANFSRDVTLSSHAPGVQSSSGDIVTGTIERVRMTRSGREISDQQLTTPATLGANLQEPADVDVTVNNGDDPPLALRSVALEMRQHSLCFQAASAQQLTLTYGDAALPAPVYDFARTYTPAAHSAVAQLGPEEHNPGWHARADTRPFTERHPHLLWIALLIVVCSLALIAFRSGHPDPPHTGG